MSINKFTKERCIPEFMKGNVKTLQAHLVRYNFALMYARNKNVLDAACGSGYGTSLLSNVSKEIEGVDVDYETIGYARDHYDIGHNNIRFNQEDLNLTFPNERFDIVISFETIEHLDNPDFFIENVKKLSNEFLFSIPINMSSEFHKSVYTIDSAKELIEKHFKKENIYWFSQGGLNINKGISPRAKYLIGYCKII
jgi:2-polyprenyl-3-methyl-5-hydroxy-6-metoxy-1,4-benzoquinol methylase